MDLSHSVTKLPFKTDPDGTVRIGGTRVTLDSVVGAFKNGSTSEEIVFQFPVLDLGDVYAVIGFYLKNLEAVEQYLARQTAEAALIQQKIHGQFPPGDARQRLLKRRDTPKPAFWPGL